MRKTSTKTVDTEDRWRGRRYICLVRQSDDRDGDTSTEAQLEWLRAEGNRLGMTHVDDIVLSGVTGSLPGNRKDLQELLNRKRELDDYDVLMVQRCDRLTRGGSDHAGWLHHEAAKLGITILYPGDDLPEDGAYRGLIMAAKFDAAKEQARSIGQRSVQGWVHALRQGRACVISRTPYGCDRMYMSGDGEPSLIIRNLGDGRQQKLDPDTRAVIDTYGRVGGGTQGHYRKQADEGVVIVPGADDKVETVRLIFDLHYNQRLGGKRIADRLNRKGILSPMGKGWSQRQVESIYENSIYCGVGLGQRFSQGIYYRRGKDRPEAIELDPQVLANCAYAPRQLRPQDDWIWQQQPAMRDFLAPALRDKALPQIKKLLIDRYERSQDPTRPKRSTSKHKTSEYILTGLLVAKQDGEALTGVLCGRVGKKVRYYRHRRGRTGYRKGSVFNKLIPAKPLEGALFQVVLEVLADAPALRQQVLKAVRAEAPSADAEQQLVRLQAERDALAAKVRLIVQTLDEDSLADAKPELDRLSARRAELDQQIAELRRSLAHVDEDPNELADRIIGRLANLRKDTQDLGAVTKRELLEAFVERVEVDMATKDAEVFLQLPPWALENEDWTMRLAHSSRWPTMHETHQGLAIRLGYARCRYRLESSRVRYCCRRGRSAA